MSHTDERLASSFEQVAPMHAAAARHFYQRLLEIAPEVEPLAKHELAGQGMMFMATLGVLVRGVCEVPALLLVAAGMAERYVTFGARSELLPQLGDALIETLAQALGDRFTADARAAWVKAYDTLSERMTGAAPAVA